MYHTEYIKIIEGMQEGPCQWEKGVFHSKSGKQKFNTKSSTETEVVGASDYLPWTIWATCFMEDQGYPMRTKIFYQDNESAMKLESDGRKSCGDKSRHIHIRYFSLRTFYVERILS